MEHLPSLFLKIEEQLKAGHYTIRIPNKKLFQELFHVAGTKTIEDLAETFTFEETQTDEYVCNILIYKWLRDHKDTRAKDFSLILQPEHIKVDLKDVSFDELMHFISPETKKTQAKK